MSTLNAILRTLFDAALYPFRDLHPLVGLTLVSLLVAVMMLLIFKATSNQPKIEAVKRKIHAGLFEIRLFNDNLRAILRAIFDILRHNVRYIGLSLVPLLWMIVPIVLIIAQLQFHYGYRGLEPGEQALLKVELPEGGAKPDAALEVPAGLRVETPPVWIPSKGELTWRLAAEEWGDYDLEVNIDGETYDKSVRVVEGVVRRSPRRPSSGFWDQLLYPAEPPLASGSPVRSITLTYPPGDAGLSGWESEITWMIVFFILSIVFAFALRKPLGVTI